MVFSIFNLFCNNRVGYEFTEENKKIISGIQSLRTQKHSVLERSQNLAGSIANLGAQDAELADKIDLLKNLINRSKGTQINASVFNEIPDVSSYIRPSRSVKSYHWERLRLDIFFWRSLKRNSRNLLEIISSPFQTSYWKSCWKSFPPSFFKDIWRSSKYEWTLENAKIINGIETLQNQRKEVCGELIQALKEQASLKKSAAKIKDKIQQMKGLLNQPAEVQRKHPLFRSLVREAKKASSQFKKNGSSIPSLPPAFSGQSGKYRLGLHVPSQTSFQSQRFSPLAEEIYQRILSKKFVNGVQGSLNMNWLVAKDLLIRQALAEVAQKHGNSLSKSEIDTAFQELAQTL